MVVRTMIEGFSDDWSLVVLCTRRVGLDREQCMGRNLSARWGRGSD